MGRPFFVSRACDERPSRKSTVFLIILVPQESVHPRLEPGCWGGPCFGCKRSIRSRRGVTFNWTHKVEEKEVESVIATGTEPGVTYMYVRTVSKSVPNFELNTLLTKIYNFDRFGEWLSFFGSIY